MKSRFLHIRDFVRKEEFDIKDLSTIVGRESQTVRKWEKDQIILGSDKRDAKNWRVYSRKRFIEILDQIMNYDWKRDRFNEEKSEEIQYIIELLKKEESQ